MKNTEHKIEFGVIVPASPFPTLVAKLEGIEGLSTYIVTYMESSEPIEETVEEKEYVPEPPADPPDDVHDTVPEPQAERKGLE